MEILACVKRVPATDCTIKVGADGKHIDPAGVEFVLNPYDEFAVEEALKTKEASSGTVTVLTIGPGAAQKDLRTCLAMGADKAVLLKHEGETPDAAATARLLAEKVKELNPGIVYCGKQAVDGDDSQVGARLAALLGWACVTDATSFELGDGTWTAQRDIEGGKESLEGSLPVVVTCNKGLNEPRYPNLKGIMMAKKKPLEETDATLGASSAECVALTPPPERAAPAILGEGIDAVDALMDKLSNEVKIF